VPIENNVGYSKESSTKQEGLRAMLAYQIGVCKYITKRYNTKYVYIDTNAGPGYVPKSHLDGSPIIFIKMAEHIGISYNAYCIEKTKKNVTLLEQYIGNQRIAHGNCYIYRGNNEMILPQVCNQIKDGSYGLVYHDQTKVPNFKMLQTMFNDYRFRHIDCLIRVPATAIKRVRGRYTEKETLVEELEKINKTHWTIRKLNPSDRWQWTFLFGTNWKDVKNYKSKGFYRIDSEIGKNILKYANLTAKEKAIYKKSGQQTLEMVL
jgi:three-Cys-motif partner protein